MGFLPTVMTLTKKKIIWVNFHVYKPEPGSLWRCSKDIDSTLGVSYLKKGGCLGTTQSRIEVGKKDGCAAVQDKLCLPLTPYPTPPLIFTDSLTQLLTTRILPQRCLSCLRTFPVKVIKKRKYELRGLSLHLNCVTFPS